MLYKHFFNFLFLVFFCFSISGQSFREPAKKKLGLPVTLKDIFTEEGITALQEKVEQLNTDYDYDIAISIGNLPFKLKKNEVVTQELLEEYEEETFDNAYKNYKTLGIGSQKKDKGILIDLSFRTLDNNANNTATSFSYQHVVFGKEASLLMKVGVGSFKQDSKIDLYTDNKVANEKHLSELIIRIGEYLELEKTYGDSILPLGPLLIYYDESIVIDKKKKSDKNYSYDWATLLNPRCVLKFKDVTVHDKLFDFSDFKLSFYYNFKKNILHSASISYKPSTPYSIGKLGFINTAIKEASLSVDKEGKLSGTVNLKASTTENVELAHMVRVNKGITGDFSFTFAGKDDFSGSFELGGIKNINIDMMKGDKALASIKNMTFKEGGVLSGKLVLNERPEFPVGVATAEVTKMDLSINYSLKEGIEIPKGVAQLKLKKIKGVKGTLKFDVNYAENKGMTCVLAQDGKNLSGFGCNFNNLKATLSIDSKWNFKSLVGSFNAKHPALSSELKIKKFEIQDGQLASLEVFDSKVSYMGFQFNLKKMQYINDELSFSANLLMKMNSNYYTDISVDKFNIDTAGIISIGKIEGELKYPAFSMKFKASYDQTRFKGSMTSKIKQLGVHVKGGFDVGIKTSGHLTYDYGFASLTLGSNTGLVIPGTPFKITQFGGLGGYNYNIFLKDENDPLKGFDKGPKYNTYVAGIELGIADNANLIGVVGKTIVVVGDELFQLTLLGDVSIPRNKPYFKGNLMLNYKYENNQSDFSGFIGTQVKIPASSGSIFRTKNMEIGFRAGPEQWWVKSDTISAELFGIINYRGILDFKGGYTEGEPITGFAAGRMGLDFKASFDKEISFLGLPAATAKGYLALSIWAAGKLKLQEDYFSLYSELGIKAEGELHCKVAGGWLYECHLKASAEAIGHLKIASDHIEAGAALHLLLVEYEDDGITVKKKDTYDFEACQRLSLNNNEFQDCPETLN